jgi:hypothetical protein
MMYECIRQQIPNLAELAEARCILAGWQENPNLRKCDFAKSRQHENTPGLFGRSKNLPANFME